ncbi:MAG: prepilin-type N-terminal cleavage/methylation domain-containing protein [Gemmatimonadaceae bacterium]
MTNRHRVFQRTPRRRPRSGMTLIEVVVACTLLAVTLTSFTALSLKMATRNRRNMYLEQRTATLLQEVNRVESMPYDSLATYLRTDSTKVGNGYYVWEYTIDPDSVSTSGKSRYKKITIKITPRLDPTYTQSSTVRRAKPPYVNPLFKS